MSALLICVLWIYSLFSFLHSELGHYMYVDSVYAKRFQEVAKLVSPMTTTPMMGCLSFYYQRDQAIGNFFSVFTKDLLGHYEEIWRPDVYATTRWKLVQVDIKAPHPLEVSDVLYVPTFIFYLHIWQILYPKWEYGTLNLVLIKNLCYCSDHMYKYYFRRWNMLTNCCKLIFLSKFYNRMSKFCLSMCSNAGLRK